MYQFSGKLKKLALALMALGIIGIAIGFISSPSSIDEVKEALASMQKMHMDLTVKRIMQKQMPM